MENVVPLLWIVAVMLAYAGIARWIVSVRDAGRTGRGAVGWVLIALAAIVPVVILRVAGINAMSLAGASLAGIAILAVNYAIAPPAKREHQKIRREELRHTILHMILATGSVIFMIPFVWLVSTSLKDDEDIFTTEVRIIPQRPIEEQFNGRWMELLRAEGLQDVAGQRPGVWARVQDTQDYVRVAPVLTSGTLGDVRNVPPESVHKIKKPGPVWENYPEALKYLPEETKKGVIYLQNTLLITLFSIVGTLLTSSMVAYAFGRLRWPGRDGLFVLLLSTMMLPYAVTMIPQFLIWQRLGFVDTLVPLWAGAFLGGGAFNIFLLRQFFKTIPTELEEAAKIDGCGYWRIFSTVMLPLVRPALATVAIMTFMGSWNNFMGPLIYISSPTKMPLAYALQLFQTVHGGEFGYLMAASTMVMIPVLVVFFFCQRYFIEGITMTGLKG